MHPDERSSDEADARGPSPLVLAVDDDDALRLLVVTWLSKAKLRCIEARNGEEALKLARAHAGELDAVVLDVMMPGIDGYETLRRLKRDEATANVAVLLLTAHATDDHHVVRAVEGGAVDHVAKPFSGPVLVAKVRAMCAQTRAARELRTRLASAEVRAARDPLTKLGNRRALEARLERELATSRDTGAPFAVVVLDVDHFKSFNDTFGHEEGDRVLVHLSDALRELDGEAGGDGAAYRFGGEEFVLVLPGEDPEGAARVARAVRETLRARPIVVGEGPSRAACTVAFSAGVASFEPSRAGSGEDLVARADAALYRAKRAGRDRVEIAADAPSGLVEDAREDTG